MLYSFLGGNNGAGPNGDLIADATGALYGTTSFGSTSAFGTVFKLTPSGSGYAASVLYRFRGGNDGSNPSSGVIADSTGALYGTTSQGSLAGSGTVFKLTPSGSGYTESILYSFQGYPKDGAFPEAGVIADATGALYGTTAVGGATNSGIVFKLTPSPTGYRESILHTFQGGVDGQSPNSLIADPNGALYGTTPYGGTGACGSSAGCGTVFKLTPSGSRYSKSVLYSFQFGSDGARPSGGLLADKTGALYGVTSYGGGAGGCFYRLGCGTIFKLTPSGSGYTESILYRLVRLASGQHPSGGLIADATGSLYVAALEGGGGRCTYGCGTVFKLTPSPTGYTEHLLHTFPGRSSDGESPSGALLADKAGALYGTTYSGGASHNGTVFKVTQ